MCLIRRASILGGLDDGAHVVRRNFGNRTPAPRRDELPSDVPLDLPALPLAGQFILDEVLGDSREGVSLLAPRRVPLTLLMRLRVNAGLDHSSPLPSLLASAGKRRRAVSVKQVSFEGDLFAVRFRQRFVTAPFLRVAKGNISAERPARRMRAAREAADQHKSALPIGGDADAQPGHLRVHDFVPCTFRRRLQRPKGSISEFLFPRQLSELGGRKALN